jgi:prephenate dehydratase
MIIYLVTSYKKSLNQKVLKKRISKMKKKIAIQGYPGAFHQQAAEEYFGVDIEVVPCLSFRELIKKTQTDMVDGALMAIENSIAGSILPNYSLLQNSNLLVVGEVYLAIQQQLLALPGVRLKDIQEVHSHPMALLQCSDFLDCYSWKLVESEDTALSAKKIVETRNRVAAAIASEAAARLYHLNILESNIQSEKANYTRFLVLDKESSLQTKNNANKASVFFEVNHESGSLARILSLIASCKINLSKLQSVPIQKNAWRYSFHVDMEFEYLEQFNKAIDKIKYQTEKLIIYGVYQRGEQEVFSLGGQMDIKASWNI